VGGRAARVVRLRLHQRLDHGGRGPRVLRLQQRGDTGGVRRRHRGALEEGVLPVRHGGQDAAVLRRGVRRLVAAVTARRGHVHDPVAVGRVVRLEVVRTRRADRDDTRQLGRQVQALARVDGALDRRGVVGAGGVVDRVRGQVVVGVAGRRHVQGALELGVQLGPVDRVQDGLLVRVVLAVVQPRVDVVAVVRDLHAVVGGEHEGADDVLRVEEAVVRVAHLDAGDLHARRDTGDADAVAGGGDLTGHVGAVVVLVRVRAPGALAGVRHAADAVGRLGGGEVRGEVRVGVVDAGVDHGDGHLAAARVDLRGLVGADGPQVPLVGLERLAARRLRRGGPDARGVRGPHVLGRADVGGAGRGERRGAGGPGRLHAADLAYLRAEVRVRRVDDADTDLVVGDHDGPAGLADRLLHRRDRAAVHLGVHDVRQGGRV